VAFRWRNVHRLSTQRVIVALVLLAAIPLALEVPALATVAFVAVALAALWWEYFDFTAAGAERSLSRASPLERGPLARDVFTLFHYPVVLGIIFYAVAAKKTLEKPSDPLSTAGRWALGLGVAFFLLGLVLMRLRGARSIAWERLVGAGAAVLVALMLNGVDAIVTLAAVIGVLVLAITVETVRMRDVRASFRAA